MRGAAGEASFDGFACVQGCDLRLPAHRRGQAQQYPKRDESGVTHRCEIIHGLDSVTRKIEGMKAAEKSLRLGEISAAEIHCSLKQLLSGKPVDKSF